jgi:hypothetical protein
MDHLHGKKAAVCYAIFTTVDSLEVCRMYLRVHHPLAMQYVVISE